MKLVKQKSTIIGNKYYIHITNDILYLTDTVINNRTIILSCENTFEEKFNCLTNFDYKFNKFDKKNFSENLKNILKELIELNNFFNIYIY